MQSCIGIEAAVEASYDYIIIGSGFGGSTAALRLVEKGYRVLMLEKGSELSASDFPKTNWNLKRWLWAPWLGFRGLFEMSFFRHVTVLSGVGVGGGSLVYACTHPVPEPDFFHAPSWAALADWATELAPHYVEAKRMLGVTENPNLTEPDHVLKRLAVARGEPDAVRPTEVAVYFGQPGETVRDPYFGGLGPDRTGCIGCGACMLGCRHDAKNTLDKNYLHLARHHGLELRSNVEVTAVRPLEAGGYRVEARVGTHPILRRSAHFTARNVIFAAGVLGTVDLLLKMREDPDGLPRLSDQVGRGIRTNNEALIGIITTDESIDMSRGVAIGSIYKTDARSHLEPVRYNRGSGFFRLLMAPYTSGDTPLVRIGRMLRFVARNPARVFRALTVGDLSKQTAILLFMQSFEGTLRLRRGWHGRLSTAPDRGETPTAQIPQAGELAHEYAREVDGTPFTMVTETLFNVPTTAHILGGACMGRDATRGVIDANHRVHGYEGLYVIDGSSVSANPGVNPSLTIVALAERACAAIPRKAPGLSRRA